jgi:hypothetical protein
MFVMRCLHNEKGIALVTSLMFTVLTLVITMTLLYMVTVGIRSSGAMKRYRTTTEAAYGGLEIMVKDIMSIGLVDATVSTLSNDTFKSNMETHLAGLDSPSVSDCLRTKLVNYNNNWSIACKNYTLDASKSFDVKFNLNSASGTPYVVYTKIVDTMEHKMTVFENKSTSTGLVMSKKTVSMAGNSDPSNLNLEGFSTTDLEGGSGDRNPHVPYTYRIEVKAERAQNALEKAAISVVYVY